MIHDGLRLTVLTYREDGCAKSMPLFAKVVDGFLTGEFPRRIVVLPGFAVDSRANRGLSIQTGENIQADIGIRMIGIATKTSGGMGSTRDFTSSAQVDW